MGGHCLQAMKIVHHYANSCFDWLIFGQQSVNPSREAISILSGKHKRFTFVHPVGFSIIAQKNPMIQVASCEQALIKTNRKRIQNHQSKTMLLFETNTLEFEFDRHLEHMVTYTYQGMQSGLPVFVVGEFDTFEIFMQNDCFA